jgi:hypothetical protein
MKQKAGNSPTPSQKLTQDKETTKLSEDEERMWRVLDPDWEIIAPNLPDM